ELAEAFCPRPVVVPALGDDGPEVAAVVRTERAKRRWADWALAPTLVLGLVGGALLYPRSGGLPTDPRPGALPTEAQITENIKEALDLREKGQETDARTLLQQTGQGLDEAIKQLRAAGKLLDTERLLFLRGVVHSHLGEFEFAGPS